MEMYINGFGKECFKGCTSLSLFDVRNFHQVPSKSCDEDTQWALHTNIGSITVLDRMTGFGWRDVETGFRDPDGKFWLASGNMDVRNSGCKTLGEAIAWVKRNSNTCVGI